MLPTLLQDVEALAAKGMQLVEEVWRCITLFA